jgi:hypothetical protein
MPSRKKTKRNISGLRNQESELSSAAPSPSLTPYSTQPSTPLEGLRAPSETSDLDKSDLEEIAVLFDSRRVDWEKEDREEDNSDVDSVWSDEEDCDIGNEELLNILVKVTLKEFKDDPDWLPAEELRKRAKGKTNRRFLLLSCKNELPTVRSRPS